MKKLVILLTVFIFFAGAVKAQEKDSIIINKDSIEKAVDEFLALLDSAKAPKSYWQLSLGTSNTQFSVNNVALNAQQLKKGVTLIPSVIYYDKSGLSFTYNNFISLSNKNSGIVQHSITPAYDFSRNKMFDFGFSYTRFIGNEKFAQTSSPYQNDFYGYLQFNQWEVQPSVALGYSTGKFTETSRTDTFFVRQFPIRDTVRFTVFDTLKVKLRDFSNIVSARHQFVFETRKAKNYFTFTPSLLLFFAKNSYDVEYTSASAFSPRIAYLLNNRPDLKELIERQIKKSFPDINETRNFLNTTNYQLQSLGLNLDAAIYLGKFYINPQVYLDYYFPEADKKFSTIFTLQAGIIF
jgi:hypothetical protein